MGLLPIGGEIFLVMPVDKHGVPIPGGGGASPNQPTFACNQVPVPSPGTAVQLDAQAVPNGFQIFIRALDANSGTIYVGPDAVTAQDHTKATPLEPGAFLELALTDVSAVWIDADDATDGVSWTVEVA